MGLDAELTLILTLVVEENGESKTTSKMMENDVMLDDAVLWESTNNTDSYMFQKSDEKTKISDKKTDGKVDDAVLWESSHNTDSCMFQKSDTNNSPTAAYTDGEVDDAVAWINAHNNDDGFDDVVTVRSSNNDLFGAKKIERAYILGERNIKETEISMH